MIQRLNKDIQIIILNSRLRYSIFKLIKIVKDLSDCTIFISTIRNLNIFVFAALWLSNTLKTNYLIVREANTFRQMKKKDLLSNGLFYLYNLILPIVYKRCDLVLANSNETAEDLSNFLPYPKSFNMKVCGNPIVIPKRIKFLEKNIEKKDESITAINIVSVGRLHAQKNYFLAIDTLAELKKQNVSFHYSIYGTGPLKNEIKYYAKRKYSYFYKIARE